MLSKIKDNAVLISSLLIFLAVAKLIYYYSLFNITIVNYLSFSELLPSILDELCFYFYCMILYIFYVIATNVPFDMFLEKRAEIKKHFQKMNFKVLFLLALSVSVLCLYKIYLNHSSSKLFLFLFYFYTFQCLVYVYEMLFSKYDKGSLNYSKITIICFVSTFIIGIFPYSTIEYNQAVKSRYNISMVDTTLACSKESNLIFVGKTENFYFTYNIITRASKATSIKELISIEQLD